MPITAPFDAHPDRYDDWFDAHDAAYRSELRAIRSVWPGTHPALEVGVGTGRFAAPLGVDVGVDPSAEMRTRARQRGIEVRDGTAEALPFDDHHFAAVLNVTTICFIDRLDPALAETRRVLRPSGVFVVGMIDRDSPLGRQYREQKDDNPFYREATFLQADALVGAMRSAGFTQIKTRQTLFAPLNAGKAPEPVRDGTGDGSFVVLRGVAPSAA
jgi:SAM-dependent methyltransferase